MVNELGLRRLSAPNYFLDAVARAAWINLIDRCSIVLLKCSIV